MLATDASGPSDYVNPSNGILCPRGDAEAFARALVDVVRGYERFDAVGIRAGVLAQIGSETVADRIVAAYEKGLTGR